MLLLGYGATEWFGKRAFQSFGKITEMSIMSTFRDSDANNHLIYFDPDTQTYKYDCYHDSGNECNRPSTFSSCNDCEFGGVIRGTTDGKRLFMLLQTDFMGRTQPTVGFSESSDQGNGWRTISQIVEDDEITVFPQDMVYIEESDKLFIFYVKKNANDLMMVSRERNNAFSSESVVVKDINSGLFQVFQAKVVYNTWEGTTMLHIFYVNKDYHLAYVKSSNGGNSWTAPKIISSEKIWYVDSAISAHKFSETIFAIYMTTLSEARMLMTSNWGSSFSYFRDFSQNSEVDEFNGLAFCGNKDQEMLAMMLVTEDSNGDHRAEYSTWNIKTMVQKNIDNPFSNEKVLSASLTCMINNYGAYNVIGLVSSIDKSAYKTNLYFGREYGHFNNNTIIS